MQLISSKARILPQHSLLKSFSFSSGPVSSLLWGKLPLVVKSRCTPVKHQINMKCNLTYSPPPDLKFESRADLSILVSLPLTVHLAGGWGAVYI